MEHRFDIGSDPGQRLDVREILCSRCPQLHQHQDFDADDRHEVGSTASDLTREQRVFWKCRDKVDHAPLNDSGKFLSDGEQRGGGFEGFGANEKVHILRRPRVTMQAYGEATDQSMRHTECSQCLRDPPRVVEHPTRDDLLEFRPATHLRVATRALVPSR